MAKVLKVKQAGKQEKLGYLALTLIREERTWAIAIRPLYANQSSKLNFPSF